MTSSDVWLSVSLLKCRLTVEFEHFVWRKVETETLNLPYLERCFVFCVIWCNTSDCFGITFKWFPSFTGLYWAIASQQLQSITVTSCWFLSAYCTCRCTDRLFLFLIGLFMDLFFFSLTEFLCKECRRIHIHFDRVDIKEIPSEPAFFRRWLHDRFEIKDRWVCACLCVRACTHTCVWSN